VVRRKNALVRHIVLDKAENESRPDLTIVVDKYGDQKHTDKDPDTVDFGDIAFDLSTTIVRSGRDSFSALSNSRATS
jgi:hypothetical protein